MDPNRVSSPFRGYRPLLPAVEAMRKNPDERRSRKKRTRLACNSCRTKRVRCDGQRPACGNCGEHRISCTFVEEHGSELRPTVLRRENDVLREKLSAFEEIVQLLGRTPADTAQCAINNLRNGSDPVKTLKTLQGEAVEPSVSQLQTVRAALPAGVHSQGELELLVRHPLVYPLVSLSPRPHSIVTTSVDAVDPILSLRVSPPTSPHEGSIRAVDQAHNSTLGNASTIDHQIGKIGNVPSYFDPRLAQLNIDFWTSVRLSNGDAAQAISDFLEFQHPVWGMFDAKLFVGDLVGFRFEFCSPFLVSSLFTVALQTGGIKKPELLGLISAFSKEANSLLQIESENDSLPTTAGLALLSISLTGQGKFTEAASCLATAKEMATRMNLFGVSDSLLSLFPESPHLLEATSATAWGVFNLIVHQTRFYSWIHPVQKRPTVPFPRESSPESDRRSSRNGVALVTNTEGHPVKRGFCEFWIIVNEIQLVLRNPDTNGSISLAFALSKFSSLLKLIECLPATMHRSNDAANHVLVFQYVLHTFTPCDMVINQLEPSMLVHTVILDLFRPFLAPEDQRSHRNYLPLDAQPRTIFAASVEQLKGLIFEYTHRYPPSQRNLWMFVAIVYCVSAVLNDDRDLGRRAYCLYYAKCAIRMRSSMKSVGEIGESILAMGYDRGILRYEEIMPFKMVDAAEIDEKRSPSYSFVMDKNSDPRQDAGVARVDSLAERFKDIVIFNELTQSVI